MPIASALPRLVSPGACMPLIPIQNLDDPRLACYRDLNQRNLTRLSGLFIAEGEKVVERLLASRFAVESLLAEPPFAERYAPRLDPSVPVYVVPRRLMCQTVGFAFHRGVLACGRRGPVPALQTWLEQRGSEPATLVVCPDVQDPTNLGSIIRAAAALGGAGLLLGRHCADPFSRRVLRVSMGAALVLPLFETSDLAEDLERLRRAGFERVAAVLDPLALPLPAWRPTPRTALLLGNEGHGLAPPWQARADRRVTIPMQAGIDSLNVAAAAGVLLYHIRDGSGLRADSQR